MEHTDVAIIGGGAAGCFAAIMVAQNDPFLKISIYEKSKELLGKVKVSGGGRCNVTHYCFDPKELVNYYPRGGKELLGPFHKFGPADILGWMDENDVPWKTEPDGRVFPQSDSSSTIIQLFTDQLYKNHISVERSRNLIAIRPLENGWLLTFNDGEAVAKKVLIAAGGSPAMWKMLNELGLEIIEPVPSLFTFNISDKRIKGLQGLSVPKAEVKIAGTKFSAEGPLLITHWGMSGPAVLKLSSWVARELHGCNYEFRITVNFTGNKAEPVESTLKEARSTMPKKQVYSTPLFQIPTRLWQSLCEAASVSKELKFADLSARQVKDLTIQLAENTFHVKGKSTFKEEFVTAGGVALREINFKTMEAKRYPGLFFAGEVLDIDALTGGFNFQAAWTTGYLAARGMTN